MPSFPTCRHRGEPRFSLVYICRSPKLIGTKLVTSEICQKCYCRDHPLEKDSSEKNKAGLHEQNISEVSHITSALTVEQMQKLIAGPPLPWPEQWAHWPVTCQTHRDSANAFLQTLPPYPTNRFQGRGVVIAGGGLRYFASLYITIRALRHVGCDLPIQVWYLGRNHEMPLPYQKILSPWGVECVDGDQVRKEHPCRILNGWELKVYATLHSPFQEVLSLDADCYPVRNPSLLWDVPDYQKWGAIFWPDLQDGPQVNWYPFGVPPTGRVTIESGQFVIDKAKCWEALQLAWWYNDHSDWTYHHGYGDKHTFEVAWAKFGQPYAMFTEWVQWSLHSFLHVGPDQELLFIHRCKDKFRLEPSGYMNPQSFPQNHFHDKLPIEKECFEWIEELKTILPSCKLGE